MKRKFFSVLLALVLVLSFSLVTAVPMATPAKAATTLNVVPFVVEATGGATAAWSTSANRTGSWGVNIGTENDGTDVGRVILAWDQNLSTITNMAYWYNLQAGNGAANWDSGPYVVLALDTTSDTSADTWVVHHMFAMSPGLGTWLKWELSDGPIASQYMATGNGTAMWHVAGATTIANASWAEVVTQFGSDTVLEIKIAVGDWASDIETRHFVDDIAINGTTYYGKIQDAIDTATALDTISVAAGTYTEDPTINKALTLSGPNAAISPNTGTRVTEAILDGQISVTGASDDVTIKGFNFTVTAGTASINCPGGFDGDDLSILRNSFTATATSNSVEAIGVHPNTAVAGLVIDDNLVTGVRGIFVNPQVAGSDVTITNNVVTGESGTLAYAGISVDGVSGNISDNTLTYFLDAGINVGSVVGPCDDLAISNNTVTHAGHTGTPSNAGAINLYSDCTDITITGNSLTSSYDGITIKDVGDALGSGIAINYNDISGNTNYGLLMAGLTGTLDAENNWWDNAAGPEHTGNPYDANNAGADSVSDQVDYSPWMIHTDLVANEWNIYSTPITPNTSTDTISEALNIIGTDSGNIASSYYYNAQTQAFVVATSLVPMVPVYLDVNTASTIDVAFSASYSSPPSRTLYQGWNLVGPAQLYGVTEVTTMLGAYEGTGEASLVGYTQIISPSIGGQTEAWVYIRAAGTAKNMIPTEGYWVYMANQGTVGGFTYTPVTIDTTP